MSMKLVGHLCLVVVNGFKILSVKPKWSWNGGSSSSVSDDERTYDPAVAATAVEYHCFIVSRAVRDSDERAVNGGLSATHVC
jgi:hypothetical protein